MTTFSTHNFFLLLGAICAPLGMLIGISMAASGNHQLAPVHAHLLLIGWVGFFLQGIYFRVFDRPRGALVVWQFLLATLGLLIMVPSLAFLLLGFKAAEPFAAASSLLILISYLIFATVVVCDSIAKMAHSSTGQRQPPG